MKLRTSIQLIKGPLDFAPLVDVVFLLLIFFLLGSAFISQPGVKVTLPEQILGGGTLANQRVLTLTRSAQIFFDDQLTDLEALPAQLKAFSQTGLDQTVILKTDVSVPHGLVMRVMNDALQSGLNVVLATREQTFVTPVGNP